MSSRAGSHYDTRRSLTDAFFNQSRELFRREVLPARNPDEIPRSSRAAESMVVGSRNKLQLQLRSEIPDSQFFSIKLPKSPRRSVDELDGSEMRNAVETR